MDYIAAMCMSHTGDHMINTSHTHTHTHTHAHSASDSLNQNHTCSVLCRVIDAD